MRIEGVSALDARRINMSTSLFWCYPSPIPSASGTARSSTAARKRVCLATNKALRRPRLTAKVFPAMGDQGKDKQSFADEDNDDASRDWDSSWKEFQKKSTDGGVFDLPPENPDEKTVDVEGQRVERLTTAWSNESGFLIGIGVIGLIGLFYGYVFATGGITGQ